MESHVINYGKHEIVYNLQHVDRKTMEISVLPDMKVIVKAPLGTEMAKIDAKLKKRARWILKQQAYFNQFHPRITERHYLSGETHFYLGRRYQLKVIENSEEQVQLKHGKFCVNTPDISQTSVKKLMQKWYRQKAKKQFQMSFERCWDAKLSNEYEKPRIQIKQMKKRWGSLSPSGILTLNIELIKAPKECIDYVVTHELCHLTHSNHSKKFYQLLEERIPNWETLKQKLEMFMS